MDHRRTCARNATRRLLRLSVLLLTGTALAGQADYQLNAGVGQSDNIERSSVDPQDETVASAGLEFSFDQQSARLQADIVGDLAYNDYLDDTFDSELLGNLVANTRAAIVPETFFWALSDNFGQVLNDPFTPATPGNRENLNYLSTGPDLQFAFGTQTRLQVGGRYALTSYQDQPLDSASLIGETGLIRDIAKGSSLGLFLRYQQLEYDQATANSDYEQSQAFLRYDAQGARTRLRIDAGFDQIDREAATETNGGMLLRLEADRRMSSRSTLALRASRQFDNSGSAFASEQSDGSIGLGTSASRQTFDPFLSERAQLDWQFSGSRTDFDLGGGWSRQTYEDQPEFDQTLSSFRASMRRALTPALSLRIDLSQGRSKFEQPDRDYDDLSGNVSIEWRMSRFLVTRLSYYRSERSSDAPQGDYTENRIWLSIGYGRGAPRDRMLGTEFAADSSSQGE